MAIVSITERPNRYGNYGQGYLRKRKRIFRVLTDSESDTEDDVGYACGVSIEDGWVSWDHTRFDPTCTCYDVTAEQTDENSLVWIVTCLYQTGGEKGASSPQATPAQNQSPGGGDSNDPTQWIPKKQWSYGSIQQVFDKAFSELDTNELVNPVVNSAGHPYRNTPLRNIKFSVLTYTRYETEFSKTDHKLYADGVNLTPWNGYAKHHVWISDWTADEEYIGGNLFFLHKRVFNFCPAALENWMLVLQDKGSRDKNGKSIKDIHTLLEVPDEWPMDGNGQFLSAADVFAKKHHWLRFPDHPSVEFSNFNITL